MSDRNIRIKRYTIITVPNIINYRITGDIYFMLSYSFEMITY